MSFDAHPPFCLACGQSGRSPKCSSCGVDTLIDPPGTPNPNTVLIGQSSDNGTRAPTIATLFPGEEYLLLAPHQRSGQRVRRVNSSFKPVGGLESVRSLDARTILAFLLLLRPFDPSASTRIVNAGLQHRPVGALRRAAVELLAVGVPDALALLPLTETESRWWQALALARCGRRSDAIAMLRLLPAGRYPDAMYLTWALSSESERPGVDEVLQFAGLRSGGSGAVEVLRLTAAETGRPVRQWLIDPTLRPDRSEADRLSGVRRLLAALRGAPPAVGAWPAPSGVPAPVIDDLIERGVKFHPDFGGVANAESRRYLMARVAPADLDERDLVALNFSTEIARRRLIRGDDLADLDITAIDPQIGERVTLARHGEASEVMREALGEALEPLLAFFNDPSVEALDRGFTTDPSLWPYLAARFPADALRGNPEVGSSQRSFLAWFALSVATQRLFDADWSGAVEAAREVLRLSTLEALRDEALNAMACAHWQLGNDDAARQALATALEGGRNAALQVNLGVIAADSDPETAALELARLVKESPTLELRVAAAMRAVGLWMTDDLPWASEGESGLPLPIRDALRSIVVEPIDLESFREIVRLQANLDDDWLADVRSLERSAHSLSAEASVYRAMAAGPEELVTQLTKLFWAGEPPKWLIEERDRLIDSLTRHAMDDPSSAVALFALNAVEAGLPIEPDQRRVLVPLAVLAVCDMIDPEEGEPADKFGEMLRQVEAGAREDGVFDTFEHIFDVAWNRLCLAKAAYLSHILDSVGSRYNDGIGQIGHLPRYQLNMKAVREAFQPLGNVAQEVEKALSSLPARRASPEVQAFISTLLDQARELKQLVNQMVR